MDKLNQAETTWDKRRKQMLINWTKDVFSTSDNNNNFVPNPNFTNHASVDTAPPIPLKPEKPEKPVKLTNILKIPGNVVPAQNGNVPSNNFVNNPQPQKSRRIQPLAYQGSNSNNNSANNANQTAAASTKKVNFSNTNHEREIPSRFTKNPHLPTPPSKSRIMRGPGPTKSGLKYPSATGLTKSVNIPKVPKPTQPQSSTVSKKSTANNNSANVNKPTTIAKNNSNNSSQIKPPSTIKSPSSSSNIKPPTSNPLRSNSGIKPPSSSTNINTNSSSAAGAATKSLQKRTFGFIRSSKLGKSKASNV